MPQTLKTTYIKAATGLSSVTVTPMESCKSIRIDGFLHFHNTMSARYPGTLKSLTIPMIEKSSYMAVLRDEKGNVSAQCLLVTGDNEKRNDLSHYPADHLHGETLIVTSLSSENGAGHLIKAVAEFAHLNGYTGLLAKTRATNTNGSDFFEKSGFTNGTTYTAPDEDTPAHYFYKSLTKAPDCCPAPTQGGQPSL
jgi:hypothetical protein